MSEWREVSESWLDKNKHSLPTSSELLSFIEYAFDLDPKTRIAINRKNEMYFQTALKVVQIMDHQFSHLRVEGSEERSVSIVHSNGLDGERNDAFLRLPQLSVPVITQHHSKEFKLLIGIAESIKLPLLNKRMEKMKYYANKIKQVKMQNKRNHYLVNQTSMIHTYKAKKSVWKSLHTHQLLYQISVTCRLFVWMCRDDPSSLTYPPTPLRLSAINESWFPTPIKPMINQTGDQHIKNDTNAHDHDVFHTHHHHHHHHHHFRGNHRYGSNQSPIKRSEAVLYFMVYCHFDDERYMNMFDTHSASPPTTPLSSSPVLQLDYCSSPSLCDLPAPKPASFNIGQNDGAEEDKDEEENEDEEKEENEDENDEKGGAPNSPTEHASLPNSRHLASEASLNLSLSFNSQHHLSHHHHHHCGPTNPNHGRDDDEHGNEDDNDDNNDDSNVTVDTHNNGENCDNDDDDDDDHNDTKIDEWKLNDGWKKMKASKKNEFEFIYYPISFEEGVEISNQRQLVNLHLQFLSMVRSSFIECNLSYSKLVNAKFQFCVFKDVCLDYCDFREADMRGSEFKDCSLVGADFRGSTLYSVKFNDCNLRAAKFGGGLTEFNIFNQSTMQASDSIEFRGCDLSECDFSMSSLQAVDFHQNNLFLNTDFRGANLQSANFSSCKWRSIKVGTIEAEYSNVGSKSMINSFKTSLVFANCSSCIFEDTNIAMIDTFRSNFSNCSFISCSIDLMKLRGCLISNVDIDDRTELIHRSQGIIADMIDKGVQFAKFPLNETGELDLSKLSDSDLNSELSPRVFDFSFDLSPSPPSSDLWRI